jgi:NitT/TauT family transport system ATP-binding protein
MSRVAVRNVWHQYGDRVILEHLTFDIEPGSFVAVAGPSGCGKSTLLRLLLGQERPSRGSIEIDGVPLSPEPGPDRGVVFQRYSAFPHLTVLGNVLLGLEFEGGSWLGRLFGASRRAAVARAEQYLQAVGLDGEADRYPHMLSGGMQQRLSIAQALIRRPKLLLLDEPFGALDPGTKDAIHRLVVDLWSASGMTILMVTHDLSEAFKLGSRVLVLDRLRSDPQAPERYGASLTYDLPLPKKPRTPPEPLLQPAAAPAAPPLRAVRRLGLA